MKRYVALGAVLTALGAGGTALVQGAAAGGSAAQTQDGGLSMMPAVIQHNAQPGALASVTVANRSAAAMAVTVTPRPWVQAATGKVAPNRRATLPGVSVDKSTFTLAPGAEEVVTATLGSAPAAGYLYGSLEVIGVPTDAATRKGVVLGYRLVGAVRILPAAPKYLITAGNVKASGATAVIPIKNAGNTLDPVAGSVKVKGSSGTKNLTVASVKVLPGKTVNLPAGTKLAKGSYTATVSLTQHGKKALAVTKKFKVK
ncbi:hypothetical protein OM076_22580 [Solirubrobacter ginsenosidimutans]|uniref:Uncharacterized protein n=1 Tax=Solirubrobacter ginsenosidimutans TaxID=490573 RepID=A0A9X3MVC5_9ACTN|nr:hypothetical protein [Solirubrobacter ginsenosidimutans]MDA0163077.1 hypothetical protein [Solirubrobacter ginsenosidimutans]